jgi:hypothetical protein
MKNTKATSLLFGLAILAVLLCVFFWKSAIPELIVFSNDGPVGTLVQDSRRMPELYTGEWSDLNSLGLRGGGATPSFSFLIFLLCGPIGFAKFDVPIAILILGFSAWTCFRCYKMTPAACLIGAAAAMLNSTFFSAACWGVAAQTIAAGMVFLAIGALADTTSPRRWLRVVMAGLAVGMAVMEGSDIGAIFSMYVALFAMYQAWSAEGPRIRNLATGAVRVGLVAVFAALLAAQTIDVLVTTQIQGVSGAGQDTRSKEQRWDWATQWSFPKKETLGIVVPGLFGYRMDTPEGGNYWGGVGRDPSWDRYFASGARGTPPEGFMRFSGGGPYAGVAVVVIGLWAIVQSFRKKDSVFPLAERKYVWFWAITAFVALLLAFGRFAPFYQFLYALPYFSTIRNPAKFLHIFNFALVMAFAYGTNRLWRSYIENPSLATNGLQNPVRSWYSRAGTFDRRWMTGLLVCLGVSLVGWLIYATSQDSMVKYLQVVGFDDVMGKSIAAFSARQVGWFILFLGLGTWWFALVQSGRFSGAKATTAMILLLLVVAVDLGRANLPWIKYWDYKEKYATNPVIEELRKSPFEQRVAILPFRPPPQLGLLNQMYQIEWAQHHFQYYNIHSLDVVQMPRMPEDLASFQMALQPDGSPATIHRLARRWELTSTRYILAAADYMEPLNRELDAGKGRFAPRMLFDIVQRPGVISPSRFEDFTAVPSTNGPYAIIEFSGALPRASLFTGWQVATNDQKALETLASKEFNPWKTVLVSSPISGGTEGTNVGSVVYKDYAPKHIQLAAKAPQPSILLLNDRFDPNWNVSVDGKPAELLRCNYLMRGVQVPQGEHLVEFKFQPPIKGLYVSLATWAVGLLVGGYLLVTSRRKKEVTP